MIEITGDELKELLYRGKSLNSDTNTREIEGYKVIIKQTLKIELKKLTWRTIFKEIVFEGNPLILSGSNPNFNNSQTIEFNSCKANNRLEIKRYEGSIFFNGNNFNTLGINECDINEFYFEKNTINTTLDIFTCKFINPFNFRDNNFRDNSLLFIAGVDFNNEINLSESNFSKIKLYNSNCRNLFFINNIFNTDNNKFLIQNCNFEKASFEKSNFGNYTGFAHCNFKKILNFKNTSNLTRSVIGLYGLVFEQKVFFDWSKVYKFEIEECTFKEIASFQNISINSILIDVSTFEKGAFFDDINILEINQCNRKTLRTIKQQLQRTDNKIDYNRFRGYELAAYYKELKWNQNFRDKFILGATWLATGFDHSWRRALVFTLSFGFLFYSLFFISERYSYTFDISHWREFISGYFRFLLITDFYNPLIKEREFLTEPLSWLIFILGKIVIAFGIYEMIQAFRKFKA